MLKIFTLIAGLALSLGLILLGQLNFISQRTPLYNFISVVSYSILGTNILFLVYKFIDWLIPSNIETEIFEKQNLAAAVFKGLILIGVALIIAAVIVSP